MKYHVISASLLFAGLVLETAGFAIGGVVLGAGVACEIWFWMRLVRRRSSSQNTHSTLKAWTRSRRALKIVGGRP